MIEPVEKRVAAFVDGQNLFYAAKRAFGYDHPNYDPLELVTEVCRTRQGWAVEEISFYTGVPTPRDNPHWSSFWEKKLQVMSTRGVRTYSGRLRHGKEKGVDVRIALDVIRAARTGSADILLIFSQDQDLAEIAGRYET